MWQKIKDSTFLRSSFTLMSGTIIAQIFSLAIYPVLTYLYPPAEFGLLGLYSAIMVIIAIIANGGYENTIMLPPDEKAANNIFALCGILTILTSLASLALIILFVLGFSHYFKDQSIIPWLYLLPLSVLLEGFYFSLSSLLNRQKNYKVLTRSKILQAVTTGIVSVAMGFFLNDFAGGLIIGFISGQAVSFLSMSIPALKSISFNDIFISEIKLQAKNFKEFPRLGIGASYLNTISRQLPFFLLPHYFGTAILGHFTLAHKILTAPLTFIGTSVSQIYYEKAARAKEQGGNKLRQITVNLAGVIGILSLFPMLIILFWGKEIFGFVFGSAYETAGQYASWIIPWIALMYIINPLSFLVSIQRKLKFNLIYNIILFIARAGVLVCGGLFLTAEGTIAAFGITGILFSLILLSWLFKISGNSNEEL